MVKGVVNKIKINSNRYNNGCKNKLFQTDVIAAVLLVRYAFLYSDNRQEYSHKVSDILSNYVY